MRVRATIPIGAGVKRGCSGRRKKDGADPRGLNGAARGPGPADGPCAARGAGRRCRGVRRLPGHGMRATRFGSGPGGGAARPGRPRRRRGAGTGRGSGRDRDPAGGRCAGARPAVPGRRPRRRSGGRGNRSAAAGRGVARRTELGAAAALALSAVSDADAVLAAVDGRHDAFAGLAAVVKAWARARGLDSAPHGGLPGPGLDRADRPHRARGRRRTGSGTC